MQRPRFSIADVMALTALIALDCLVWRKEFDRNLWVALFRAFALFPLNLLAIVGYVLVRKTSRGESPYFLAGFLPVGLLTVCVDIALARRVFGPAFDDEHIYYNELLPVWTIALPISMLSALQLIPALIGGLLYRRHKVTTARRGRSSGSPP